MSKYDKYDKKDKVPPIDTKSMTKWKFLMGIIMDASGCELAYRFDKPVISVVKLRRLRNLTGAETSASRKYASRVRKNEKKWKRQDKKALSLIVQACDSNPSAMEVILAEENANITATKLMDKLIKRFDRGSLIGVVQQKIASFNTLEISTSEKTETYINRLLEARRELIGLGQKYFSTDVHCLGRLKESLLKDPRYSQLALNLRSSQEMTWDQAVAICNGFDETLAPPGKSVSGQKQPDEAKVARLEEQVRQLYSKMSKSSSKSTPDWKKKIKCHNCGKFGHLKRECRDAVKSSNGGNQRNSKKCTHCGIEGHTYEECHKRKRDEAKGRPDPQKQPRTHFDDFPHKNQMLKTDSCSTRSDAAGAEELLTMDSGATTHMVSQSTADSVRESDLTDVSTTIKTALDGATFQSSQRGQLGDLSNVLITPDGVMTEGVASVAQLDIDGKWVVFGGGEALLFSTNPLTDPNQTPMARTPLGPDRSYKFKVSDLTGETTTLTETVRLASATPVADIKFWHCRMGHKNIRDLAHAISHGLVTGPDKDAGRVTKLGVCADCVRAKSTRRSFSRGRSTVLPTTPTEGLTPLRRVIPLVVTDLKGPFSVAGPSGELYFQLYTEVDTSYRTVVFLNAKSDAFDKLKQYFTRDVKAAGQVIQRLHADGAPELIAHKTVDFLASEECTSTYSPSYTPERNGVAERSNRTIWESGYAMWLASSLPAFAWIYAVQYAVIITNHMPTKTALYGRVTPIQAKYGVTPSIARFRIFGCICYVHIPTELRDKTFAEKAYTAYFLGLTWPMMDRYQCYVPSLDKVQESAHVIFDEVTPVKRSSSPLLVISPEKKSVADYTWMTHMVYFDDENSILYAVTRVTTSRGFVVGYRAPIINGRLTQEESTPIHAADTERMIRLYWQDQVPRMWKDDRLTIVTSIAPSPQGAPDVDDEEQPDQLQAFGGASASSASNTATMRGSPHPDVASAPEMNTERAPASGMAEADVSAPPHKRVRRQTRHLNVGTMGDTTGTPRSEGSRLAIDVSEPDEGTLYGGSRGVLPCEHGIEPPHEHDGPFMNGLPLSPQSANPNVSRDPLIPRPEDSTPEEPSNKPFIMKALYLAVESLEGIDDERDIKWEEAKMAELMSHIFDHDTYELALIPDDANPLRVKWVVKEKPDKLKARMCPLGCGQEMGVDYNETWAPTAKLVTLRIFLTIVAIMCLFTVQLDIKTAFLNPFLKEEIWCKPLRDHLHLLSCILQTLTDEAKIRKIRDQMDLLQGPGRVGMRLKKCVYGLKQAPREWYLQMHEFLTALQFRSNEYDVCMYTLHLEGGQFLLLLLYVDDILLAGTSQALLDDYTRRIGKRFKLGAEGPLTTYLGIKLERNFEEQVIDLSMEAYILKIYARFGLVSKSSVNTPMREGLVGMLARAPVADARFIEDFEYREKIGCLIYLMICMRADICYHVGLLARYSNKVSKVAASGVTHLLHFVWNTRHWTLKLGGRSARLRGFADSDWAGCPITRKSTCCVLIYMGDGLIDWRSMLTTICHSSGAAEFVALDPAARRLVAFRWLLSRTGIKAVITRYSSALFSDSTTALSTATNEGLTKLTREAGIKYMYVKEMNSNGVMTVQHVGTASNPADIGTKILGRVAFHAKAEMVRGLIPVETPTGKILTRISDEFV